MQSNVDSSVPGITNYPAIALGNGAKNDETGLFATDKNKKTDKIDLVIFLHGQGQKNVIDYWKKEPFKLREEANRSTKGFFLAVPYLNDPVAPGTLASDPDSYITAVLKSIGDPDKAPTLNNLILAAHSGGGGPMLQIAKGLKTFDSNLKACWGFDSMYQPNYFQKGQDIEPMWLQVMLHCVQSNPDVQFLFNYSSDPDTSRHSVKLLRDLKALAGGIPHLTIDISATPLADLASVRKSFPAITTNHDAMVRDLWFSRLSKSTFLT
jgi:hypothetical protein